MTISFTRTREQTARLVLRKLGTLAANGADNSADMEVIYEAIDLRLKEIHRLGVFWKKVGKVPLPFSVTASTNSASATADILFPLSMTITNGSMDEPVDVIGVLEYAKIENKSETGLPTKALWKGGAEFIFHPVPTAAATAKLVYEKVADDTVAATAPDVEVSMVRWLKDIIAYDVGDEFGASEQRMMRWSKECTTAEKNIRKLSVERKAYSAVKVEDFDPRTERRETDYGR